MRFLSLLGGGLLAAVTYLAVGVLAFHGPDPSPPRTVVQTAYVEHHCGQTPDAVPGWSRLLAVRADGHVELAAPNTTWSAGDAFWGWCR